MSQLFPGYFPSLEDFNIKFIILSHKAPMILRNHNSYTLGKQQYYHNYIEFLFQIMHAVHKSEEISLNYCVKTFLISEMNQIVLSFKLGVWHCCHSRPPSKQIFTKRLSLLLYAITYTNVEHLNRAALRRQNTVNNCFVGGEVCYLQNVRRRITAGDADNRVMQVAWDTPLQLQPRPFPRRNNWELMHPAPGRR